MAAGGWSWSLGDEMKMKRELFRGKLEGLSVTFCPTLQQALVKLFSCYMYAQRYYETNSKNMSRLERPPSENQGDYPRAADGTIDFTRMTERQQLRFLMSGGADNATNTSSSSTSSSDNAAAKSAATPEPPAKRTSSRRASSRSSKNVSSTPDAGSGSLKRARTASRGKSPGPLLSDKKSKTTTTTSKTLKKDSKKESVTSGGSGSGSSSASGRSKTTPRGGATKAKGGRGSRSTSSIAAVAASPRNPAVSSPRPGN